MGFEPGTEQPTHYVSQVRLTDPSAGIKEQAAHDLDEQPPRPPRVHVLSVELHPGARPTHGRVHRAVSVDLPGGHQSRPARSFTPVAVLVVFGTFLQFYMRAGVFTDGGKKERERAPWRKSKPRPAEAAAGVGRPLDRVMPATFLRTRNDARRPPGDAMMKRIGKQFVGLVLAGAFAALPARSGCARSGSRREPARPTS